MEPDHEFKKATQVVNRPAVVEGMHSEYLKDPPKVRCLPDADSSISTLSRIGAKDLSEKKNLTLKRSSQV